MSSDRIRDRQGEEQNREGRAVIFDLDGTLAATLGDIADCLNSCLETMGERTRPEDDYRFLVGDGLPALCRRLLSDPGEERIEELRQMAMARYKENPVIRTKPYPGVPAMLERLREHGIPMAVLSNKPDYHTRVIVEQLFPEGLFLSVEGFRDSVPRKPDPSSALAVAERFSLEPGAIFFVGDTAVDMKTAVAAGMHAVGVLWGFRGRDELLENGAAALVERPEEIAALILEPGQRFHS